MKTNNRHNPPNVIAAANFAPELMTQEKNQRRIFLSEPQVLPAFPQDH